MAEKGRHSNGAIGSRWTSAQRARNATLAVVPLDRPRSLLDYRKGDRRMPPGKPPAASAIRCYFFARTVVVTNGQYRPLVAEQMAAVTSGVDILLQPVRRDPGPGHRRLVGHGG